MSILKGGMDGKLEYYEVEVTATRLGESKGGTACVEIDFRCAAPEGSIIAWRYFTKNAWQYTEADLKVLGWDAEARGHNFEELNTGENSPIVGAKAQIAVGDEEYNGKVSSKVAFINAPGGKRAVINDSELADAFDSFRKTIGVERRSVAGGSRIDAVKSAVADSTQKPVTEGDVNIPFAPDWII